ncbi:RNA-directed DNA polymerase, eukaryota, Reverse transcriptase zinc-binding domain protein [Artemisia annua]|uniref:RNA-directed DNA polymerase, eukaryota, Reverse transcriptase zinc-binding domain protein n=1 Tax=Artemisia annua TaxID=35608 RepID=A0A2U1L8Z5_ARTAN|nr:RNA-directed DNA polymerase, eukaryota, Reverse transcriptase zinc-binding domain protein [Artemisia annua]
MQIGGKQVEWYFKGKPGDGVYLRFWKDRWLGDTLFKDRWPRLYSLESNKNCSISDRISHSGTAFLLGPGWNVWPSTVEEISEMNDVNYMLNNIRFVGSKDVWKWDEEGSNHFSVANVKRMIRLDRNNNMTHLFKWESWIPLKINIHLWRAEMGRIPTRLALQRRQIVISSTICVLCDVNDEDCNHIFVHCGFAFGVWSIIRRWCKLDYVSFDDMEGLLKFYKYIQGPKWAKKLIRGIVMTTCWAIWNARNKRFLTTFLLKFKRC